MKTRSFLKKLLSPLLLDKQSLLICTFRGLFRGFFLVSFSYFFKIIVDGLSLGNQKQFLTGIFSMAFLFVFSGPLGHVFRYQKWRLLTKMQWCLYNQYLQRYITADNNTIEQLGTGRANSILQKGVDNRSLLLRDIPMEGVSLMVSIVGGIGLLIYQLGIGLGIVIVLFFILSFLIGTRGNKRVAKRRNTRRETYIESDRNIVRYIMSKFEILQNNKIKSELTAFANFESALLKYWRKESLSMIASHDAQKFVIDIVRVLGGIWIGNEIFGGRLTVGDFVLFRTLMKAISDNVEKMNGYITDMYQQLIYVERLWSQFDNIPSIKGLTTGSNVNMLQGMIVCDNLTFHYPDGEYVFQNFSCDFGGGKKTALVGRSGSGKSTLVKLLAGYLHPMDGLVSVDGQSLDDVALMSYYQHIGYLTQEPNVFDGTIRENMLYGLSEEALCEDDAVIQQRLETALRLAKCDFVYEFKDGLDTEIGEKGIRLSGGQRQRLAIAKIMLKDPKLIILDEPTSALDSFSEEAITEAMHNLFEGRTVIIIAHRLQTVKAADEILVLDKQPGAGAQVIERGTHEELVKKGGYYARMLEVQTGF